MGTASGLDREALAAAPHSYFKAVDAKDVDATLSHYAEDATLTVQTDGVTFSGHSEIGRMFSDFFSSWDTIYHEITNIVVEPTQKKASTEQHVDLKGESRLVMHNCNFFDFNDDGKFQRVIIWMDGSNPLQ